MHPTPCLAAALLAGSGLGWPLLAQADLVEDSHASLELRNFYFNRDFRQSGARDNADEWAQGFLLRLESGFSEGTVGFGVDAIGLLGFKLDSGSGSGGTGLLPADGSAGGDYRLTPALTASLHQGRLRDIYRQTFAGLVHTLDLGGQRSLKSDLRFARASEDGGFRELDNRAFGALFSLRLGAHAVAAGYQRISGDDPYPYIAGSDPYLVNFIQIGDFGNVDERSWQLRYDYDFGALGLPGLSFMSRYVSGDNVARGAANDGKEWERNTDLGYVVQSGPLKNLGVKWRNATVRSNFANDLDENRLILSYSLTLW